MALPNDNANWVFDYGLLEDIPVAVRDLSALDHPGAPWSSHAFIDTTSLRFMELGALLDSGKQPKVDKSAILVDAVRIVTQLRDEAQKLKESNDVLQEKINELKDEKNELRHEKQRLKTGKENLEQQLKALSTPLAFLPHPPGISAPFSAPGQVVGNKLVPFVGYPGVSMWQFMPPAVVDTSQDHVLRPPVA